VTQAEWLRFDDFDAFAGQDAALLKTGDLDACKASPADPSGNHRGNRKKKAKNWGFHRKMVKNGDFPWDLEGYIIQGGAP
jgi:hypothetical protein